MGDILGFAIDLDAGVMRLSHQGKWHSGAAWPRLSTLLSCKERTWKTQDGRFDAVSVLIMDGGCRVMMELMMVMGAAAEVCESGPNHNKHSEGQGSQEQGCGRSPEALPGVGSAGIAFWCSPAEFHVSGGLCHEI